MTTESLWPGWKKVRQIGAGSFGKVYEIEREENGVLKKAALKVMSVPPAPEDVQYIYDSGLVTTEQDASTYIGGQVQTVVQEIRTMAQLKGHPNIVEYQAHRMIPHDGWLGSDIFIRMELLMPLNRYIRSHSLREQEITSLGVDICRALEACQTMDPPVLHRDIKPANIMMDDNGTFKLGDFGVARVMEGTKSAHTRAGTEDYMAPEVLQMKGYFATADIYSLGMVLYRMLNNNRNPFLPLEGIPDTQMQMQARANRLTGKRIPPPKDGSEELKRVILKALEYDPKDRYQTAIEFRWALERCNQSKMETTTEEEGHNAYEETVQDSIEGGTMQGNADGGTMQGNADGGTMQGNADGGTMQGNADGGTMQGNVYEETVHNVDNKTEQAHQEINAKKATETGTIYDKQTIPQQDKKQNRMPIVIIAFILLVVVAAVFISRNGKDTSYVEQKTIVTEDEQEDSGITLEDYAGRDIDATEKELEQNGINVDVSEVYSDSVPEGAVISQSKKAGTDVEVGDSITLTVSLGTEPFALDDYTGQSLEDAKTKAESLGLRVNSKKKFSSDVKKGNIIKQKPEPNSKVRKGDGVVFTVSMGVEKVKVPSLVGINETEAEKALKKVGLKVGEVSREYSGSVDSGNIISQSKDAGEKVEKNTTISYTVSKGPEPKPASKKSSSSKKRKHKKKKKKKSGGGATNLDA